MGYEVQAFFIGTLVFRGALLLASFIYHQKVWVLVPHPDLEKPLSWKVQMQIGGYHDRRNPRVAR